MQQRPFQSILDVFKCQVIASALGFILVAFSNHAALLSFFLGEAAMLLGNAFLTWRVYYQRKRLATMPILFSFLGGEVGKYVLLVVLTLIFAKTIPLNWLFYAIGIVTPQFFGVISYFLKSLIKKPR